MMDFIKTLGIISKNFKGFKRKNENNFLLGISAKELLFNDFIELISRENCLFENDVNTVKNDYRMIQNEPESYLKKLIGNDNVNSRYWDISHQFLYCNLLKEYMFQFEEDIWKPNVEGLKKNAKEGSHFSFETRNKESNNDTASKIKISDTHSAFTLLNIDDKIGNYNLFLCKKQDKKKFLELVKNLGLPIVEL
jgi:hypothetical protein